VNTFLLALSLITPPHHKVKITTISGLQDEYQLTEVARQYMIPPIIMWVIAFKESGVYGNNLARGPGVVVVVRDSLGDSVGYKRICREIGRMQIAPCIVKDGVIVPQSWAWLSHHCTHQNLYSYYHNIRCGAAILHYRKVKLVTWNAVIMRYNGVGTMAQKYRKNAKQIIGDIILRMIERQSHDSLLVESSK